MSALIGSRHWRLLVASALFALAIGFAVARVGLWSAAGGIRVGASWAMTDFFSAAYKPVHAVLEGQTPYTRDSTFPPYAPTQLLVHLPFALLPPTAAAIAYFLCTILLTLALAVLALRLARVEVRPERVLVLAGAVLLSRPGHWTLLLGQVSILLSVLTYIIFVCEQKKSPRSPPGHSAASSSSLPLESRLQCYCGPGDGGRLRLSGWDWQSSSICR